MRWQYRTLLFEFQKDGLLGDKYLDDEDVEEQLNEQGVQGWELVNVAMIQEGLLAFCKRPVPHGVHSVSAVDEPVSHCEIPKESVSADTIKQQERTHIQGLEERRGKAVSALDHTVVGNIKIS